MYTCIIWQYLSLPYQFKKLDMPEHNKSALEAWGLLFYTGEKKEKKKKEGLTFVFTVIPQ